MRSLGIDLGTTNTLAAADGRPLAVGDGGESVLPSVVAFLPNGSVQVGAGARRRRAIDGPNVIFSSKRIIGLGFDDALTREFHERYPFEIVANEAGLAAFRTRAGLFTPTDVAAMLLSRIHQRIGRDTSGARIAITVPRLFSETQREATLAAARRAGFDRAHLVEEPMGTFQAYRAREQVMRRAAVYDLGGGTFQLSVIDCTGASPRVVAHGSDPFLGGDDIDHEIARWVATEVTKLANWDLGNYAGVRTRLLAEAERAKIALSEQAEVLINVSQVDPECPLAADGITLRREVLERLCDPLVRRTFLTCDRALRAAGIAAGDIDTVLFAGGSTHLAVVRQGVEAYFGSPGLREIPPTDVVALGASLTGS